MLWQECHVSSLAGDAIECKEYGETRKTIKVGFDLRLQEIIDRIVALLHEFADSRNRR